VVWEVRFFWLLQVGVVLLAPPAIYAWRHRGDRERALKGAALVLASMYAAFSGLFAVGETFADPGGWVAVGATAAWLIPLVALSLMAWHRPRRAATALGALLLALGGLYLWSVVAPQAWTTFEDSSGPIRALIAVTLALPMAALGWRQPRVAGVMLIALPALPTVMLLISVARGLGAEGWPMVIVTAPAGIIGALYLMVGSLHPTPGRLAHSGPAGRGG
jgi:hypothetical protein